MSLKNRVFAERDQQYVQKNLEFLESQIERLSTGDGISHIARKRLVCSVGFMLFSSVVLIYNLLFFLTGNSALIMTGVIQLPLVGLSVLWLLKGRFIWPHLSHYALACILITDTLLAILFGQGTLLNAHFYFLFFAVGTSVTIPCTSPRSTFWIMLCTLCLFLMFEFVGYDAHPEIASLPAHVITSFQIFIFVSMSLCVGSAVYFADWSYYILENRLITLASQDFLTGLPNRRAFHSFLSEKRILTNSLDDSYCICILDIDHFKRINDQYGHDTGDEVLKFVAQQMKKAVRAGDFVARIGGEEFVLLMPKTQLKDGIAVAERLREAIALCEFVGYWGSIQITVSLGMAQYFHGSTNSELIDIADRALYRAKQGGRNKLEIGLPISTA
ncbi:GGDEF domain-containing protein [Rhodoferax mekongensis]|uniref:GGDEF domain-containing protein n=1 Tax=Rhodoferax mekongensis TaxID=3068341 RepID=UPI0028BD65EF|nr:GGDEF domain-containing protein [Rhodoferax sp. TBRC 17199]MDT7517084.1 GGDEF domain-containing protein [Rhodoferax sp. TBRC 17199]